MHTQAHIHTDKHIYIHPPSKQRDTDQKKRIIDINTIDKYILQFVDIFEITQTTESCERKPS